MQLIIVPSIDSCPPLSQNSGGGSSVSDVLLFFVKDHSAHYPEPLCCVRPPLLSASGRSRVPDLTKRAYLARFLKNIDIPEEFFNDETLVEMYRQFKQMQARARVENKICKTYLIASAQININFFGWVRFLCFIFFESTGA
jgi:hypothetical protein